MLADADDINNEWLVWQYYAQDLMLLSSSTACPRRLPQSSSNERGLASALQAWNQEDTGYGHSIIFLSKITSTKPRSQIPFILTAPPKKETEAVTDRQLTMAMNTWAIKNQGFAAAGGDTGNVKSLAVKEGSVDVSDGGDNEAAVLDNWDPKTSDYYSERNSYEVDDEDATAAVGYCK